MVERVAASRDRGLKFIAFYLPQFHPIPENDRWWGKGFTEWTNVTKAQPLFEGHYQPHLPADFGFYDLRVRDVQHQQIECAKRFGIDAFCFYYYWFGTTRLLERPVEDFLGDPRADINFCLCWANENWTRRWDGSEREILIQQTYSPENDVDFIKDLVRFFRDTRYMRVNHAPLLLVYCPQHIPDPKATTTRWRQYCREVGIGELHLVAALVHGNFDFEQFGFDAAVEFPPHNIRPLNLSDRVGAREPLQGLVANYEEVARAHLERNYANSRIYRSVFPSWDNTARAQRRATIILNSSPDNYERWLEGASERTIRERAVDDRLLFINAWNEWAEGCHLEPDRKNGFGFLEATQRVKAGRSELEPDFSSSIPAIAPSLSTRALLRIYNLLKPYPAAFQAARSIYHLIRRV